MATTQQNLIQVGSFCWADLMSTDKAQTLDFYHQVLGWTYEEVSLGLGAGYTVAMARETAVGGINQMDKKQIEAGVPSHWVGYVLVDNVKSSVSIAKKLGAKLLLGPLKAGQFGTMAALEDPTGAVFALWMSKSGDNPKPSGVGTFCWPQLVTGDTEVASRFYQTLFNWKSDTLDSGGTGYTYFISGEEVAAGMMSLPEDAKNQGAPSHWLLYLSVEDCDRTVATAEELGGRICVPPIDLQGVGRGAVVTDPAGAAFGVVKLLDQES